MEAEKESRSRKVYTGMRQECKGDEGIFLFCQPKQRGTKKPYGKNIVF